MPHVYTKVAPLGWKTSKAGFAPPLGNYFTACSLGSRMEDVKGLIHYSAWELLLGLFFRSFTVSLGGAETRPDSPLFD